MASGKLIKEREREKNSDVGRAKHEEEREIQMVERRNMKRRETIQ